MTVILDRESLQLLINATIALANLHRAEDGDVGDLSRAVLALFDGQHRIDCHEEHPTRQ